ncbi:MAG TPA: hypothetical protein DEF45_23945 [Rhodopirellula sp.]|nr:hypothetical protein [Rhodopirellula sp.]
MPHRTDTDCDQHKNGSSSNIYPTSKCLTRDAAAVNVTSAHENPAAIFLRRVFVAGDLRVHSHEKTGKLFENGKMVAGF